MDKLSNENSNYLEEYKKETEKIARQKRKEKKNKMGKPFNAIMPIKNPDKVGAENWTKNRAKNLANFPSPQRIVLVGGCNSGKSTVMKNLIISQRPPFKEVYIIHQDADYTKEYDDLEPTSMLSDVPPIEFFNLDGKFRKRAVIIDDLELTSAHQDRLKNLAILFRYASTHRGLTIYFAHQSFFDIPSLVKKMASVFILWKPRSFSELTMIENRTGLEKGALKELFNNVANGFRDSICIDLSKDSPAKLRLNVHQPIEYQSENELDEEDESDE